jgi:hypothetical protein
MNASEELFHLMLGRTTTKAVQRILAAGYRRPRVVTTVEELDVLGRNAAILEPDGSVWVNDGQIEDPWASYAEDPFGGPIWTSSSHITLPATVLHEPEADQ